MTGIVSGVSDADIGSLQLPSVTVATDGDEAVHDVAVTAENWQEPPFNRWAYWHVKDILPTQRVSRGGGPPRDLPAAVATPDLMEIGLTRVDGSQGTAADVMAQTYTDAYVVLHDGALVTQWYGPEGAAERTHSLMSVTKSVVGAVTAVLIDQGRLKADHLVTDYVPELAASGYADASVRHVLDMRSGVRFREEYKNPDAEVSVLGQWIGGAAMREDDSPGGLYGYLAGLQPESPHGQRFLYRSAETDVLGWVCERAADQPMADLIATLIWQPMGAEFDAEILCDTTGTAVHDGGLCGTARDVARFGQMLLDGGTVPDGRGGTRTVIEPRWLREAWAVDADARSVFAASPAEISMPGGWYRNQFWFRPGEYGDTLLCLGIHGQMVHVSRRTRTVCVKFSTWPQPQNPGYMQDTLRAFDAIGGVLSGAQRTRDRRAEIISGASPHATAEETDAPEER